MSIFEDILNNISDYPELGELIPDDTAEKQEGSVLAWIEGKGPKPNVHLPKEFPPER